MDKLITWLYVNKVNSSEGTSIQFIDGTYIEVDCVYIRASKSLSYVIYEGYGKYCKSVIQDGNDVKYLWKCFDTEDSLINNLESVLF